jgi:hypothetical protein
VYIFFGNRHNLQEKLQLTQLKQMEARPFIKLPVELVQLILDFHDSYDIGFKRQLLNMHYRNFFYPDFFLDFYPL